MQRINKPNSVRSTSFYESKIHIQFATLLSIYHIYTIYHIYIYKRDKPIRQAETSCIVANIQRKFVPERVARRLPVSRRLRRGGGRLKGGGNCNLRPANECDVPVTAYKGIPRHRVIVMRDNGDGQSANNTRPRALSQEEEETREREPTAHKASYRVLPDVLLRPFAWTTHDVPRERTCFSRGDCAVL